MHFRNPFGFSLLEVSIALGITAAVGVGGFQLMSNMEKDKVLVKAQSDSLLVENDVRGFFLKEGSCAALVGKAEGATDLVFQIGSRTYAPGQVIGTSEITGLSYQSYHPVSPDGLSGIARIELLMKSKNSNKGYRRMIPVGVRLKDGLIQNCDARMTDIYTKLADMVCQKTYGSDSAGKSCVEVVLMVKEDALTSICADVYGTKAASYLATVGKHCDLSLVHAGDNCASGSYVTGFDVQGKVQCAPSPFPLGAIPPPVFASCSGQSLSWLTNCSDTTITGAHLSSQPLSDSSGSYLGGATATCYNGTWSLSGATCSPSGCNPTSQNWLSNCSAGLPATGDGSSVMVSNSAAGFSGSATFACSLGSWQAPTGTTCEAGCSTQTLNWPTTCNSSALGGPSGTTRNLTYSSGGYNGSATATCSNGSWNLSGESCSSTGCSATTATPWLTNCKANLPARAEGANATVTNSAAGFSGSATFACSGGVWQAPTGTTCKADCNNENISWLSNCSDTAASGADGVTRSLSFNGGGYLGSATATCNNGVWNLSGENCATGGCNLTPRTWLTNCSATLPSTAEGASVTVASSAPGFSGSASFTCSSGTWQSPTGTSCQADCSTETLSWNANCSASAAAGANGVVRSLSSSSGGYNGAATATCNNGVWNVSGGSCSQTDCGPTTGNWSTNCQASLPLRGTGDSVTVTNSAAGFSGSATFACSNGTWQSPTGVTCNTDCSTQNVPWLTNCSASASSGAHSTVRNLSHSGGGYTGNATATCSNGTWSVTSPSCSSAGCNSVSRNWGPNCSATVPSTAEGASVTVSSSAAGSTGTATFTCSGGTFGSPTSIACHQDCSTQSLNWNSNCGASASGGIHGTVRSLTSSTAGFAGTATATCSDGTWSISGGSCASTDCPATPASWLTNCSGNLPLTASGGNANVSNGASGYSGTATYSCSNGSWSAPSGATCTQTGAPCLAVGHPNVWHDDQYNATTYCIEAGGLMFTDHVHDEEVVIPPAGGGCRHLFNNPNVWYMDCGGELRMKCVNGTMQVISTSCTLGAGQI